MDNKNEEFLKHLIETFKEEAAEHIKNIAANLVELEKSPEGKKRSEIIEVMFREFHSLKGAARSVGAKEIEKVCQVTESVFSALKERKIGLAPGLFDIIYETVSILEKLLLHIGAETNEEEKDKIMTIEKVLREAAKGAYAGSKAADADVAPQKQFDDFTVLPDRARSDKIEDPAASQPADSQEAHQAVKTEAAASQPAPSAAVDTVRISAAKLNAILLQTEEMLYAKISTNQVVAELKEVLNILKTRKNQLVKVLPEAREYQNIYLKKISSCGDASGPDNVKTGGMSAFFEEDAAYIKAMEEKITGIIKFSESDHKLISAMVDNLLWDMKKVLMLPFSSLLEVFPRVVRDISHDQGKEAELIIKGQEIEIDRRILEELKDPLIHLVRNCIDHGIEKPKVRQESGKPPRGTISITVSQKDSSTVELVVSDDGAGIDIKKIKESAVKKNIVSEEAAQKMTENEALNIIYHSGFSTSDLITDISGRGLGLAILREKTEKLGGVISLFTRAGEGTTFKITLPLTLSTFRGVAIRVDEQLFIIPTINIERVVKIKEKEIRTVENREMIEVAHHPVSMVRLADILETRHKSAKEKPPEELTAVLLGSADKKVAFLIDEVLDEQEILVKNMGKQLIRVRNIAGTTVLSNRQIAPILNVSDLIKSAVKSSAAGRRQEAASSGEEKEKQVNVLVVEDSITARTLLKNILESSGYKVKTAVDGIDAVTILKTEEFDIVVSDVDMPRMNGFDLTAKIRADKKLAEIPVILVTALESREHREMGIEAGANAYITKSTFDQSNLLDVMKKLL